MAPCNGVGGDGADDVEAVEFDERDAIGPGGTLRRHDDADIGVEQRHEIRLGDHLVHDVRGNASLFQVCAKRFGMLAIRPAKQALLAQFLGFYRRTRRKGMFASDGKPVRFGEQQPRIQSIPGLAQWSGHGDFHVSPLQKFRDLAVRAAPELKFQAWKNAHQLRQK